MENSKNTERSETWNIISEVLARLPLAKTANDFLDRPSAATEIENALKNMESSSRIMPRSLTAENGAKALLNGEFYEEYEVEDRYNDNEWHIQKVPVSWITIKEIYKKIVTHYGA